MFARRRCRRETNEMSAIWRIFHKDLRRYWPLLLAIWALAAMNDFIPFTAIDLASGQVAFFLDLIEAVEVFVLALAIVALVQEDPLSGDRSTWLTRPIRAAE